MRYNVKGNEIRSENAARSVSQASKWVLNQVSKHPKARIALDYGCGKLRYTISLLNRFEKVIAVDSDEQISRTQVIHGVKTTIREFLNDRYPNRAQAYSIPQKAWQRRYDFVLCSNVLSAIPSYAVRGRLLLSIRNALRKNGSALVLNQFRNSFFSALPDRDDTESYLDGWIINSRRGMTSFYAIIPPDTLGRMCRRVGLVVKEIGTAGEIGYCVVALA